MDGEVDHGVVLAVADLGEAVMQPPAAGAVGAAEERDGWRFQTSLADRWVAEPADTVVGNSQAVTSAWTTACRAALSPTRYGQGNLRDCRRWCRATRLISETVWAIPVSRLMLVLSLMVPKSWVAIVRSRDVGEGGRGAEAGRPVRASAAVRQSTPR